ncbi:hypothetical protein M885DRAFT_561804 [Pelagophyceae sp. CCMP2097]|nr:hypothetical protein M885DRAFT_561804 [Pelagophyceae sp. CCMP2097]
MMLLALVLAAAAALDVDHARKALGEGFEGAVKTRYVFVVHYTAQVLLERMPNGASYSGGFDICFDGGNYYATICIEASAQHVVELTGRSHSYLDYWNALASTCTLAPYLLKVGTAALRFLITHRGTVLPACKLIAASVLYFWMVCWMVCVFDPGPFVKAVATVSATKAFHTVVMIVTHALLIAPIWFIWFMFFSWLRDKRRPLKRDTAPETRREAAPVRHPAAKMDAASIILGRAAAFLETRAAWGTVMPVSQGARASALLNIEVVCLSGRAAAAADTATFLAVVAVVLDRTQRQLTTLMISNCVGLETLPAPLSDCTRLTKLDLSWSFGLTTAGLERLVDCAALATLHLSDCYGFTALPERLGDCAALTRLQLRKCSSLATLPTRLGDCAALTTLELYSCSRITTLPGRLGDCAALTTMQLSGCTGLTTAALERLGDCAALTALDLSNCDGLTALPARLGDCAALTTLDLSGCDLTRAALEWLGDCTALTTLQLSGCDHLYTLPARLVYCAALTTLILSGCPSLYTLPALLGDCAALTALDLSNCDGITGLPARLGDCAALTKLNLSGCSNLVTLPARLGDCAALTTLDLSWCFWLTAAALVQLGDCAALTTLYLSGCSRLTSLPARLSDCSALTTLLLSGCSRLTAAALAQLGDCAALTTLNLSGCSGLTAAALERLGDCGALTTLDLSRCNVGLLQLAVVRRLEARGCAVIS